MRAAHAEISRKERDALVGTPHAPGTGLCVDLVRVPPSGTWERRRADRFGPAMRADIASYTGLSHTALSGAYEQRRLRTFRSEGGDELLDVARGALPDPDTPAPVRYLPTWDATLLVHARRARILPAEHRPKIFGVRIPQSRPTFLVDGSVAGAWRYVDGRTRASRSSGWTARPSARSTSRRSGWPRFTRRAGCAGALRGCVAGEPRL